MYDLILKVPDVVKLQVSQVVKIQHKNTTSNPMTIEITETDETTFQSTDSIESIREATKSHKFSSSVNASGSIFGVKSSSSAGYEFSDLIKTYYRAAGTVEKFQKKTTETKFTAVLSPGDELKVYTNTLSGGGYVHTWDTTEKLTDATQTIVTITVGYDLTHIFDELMMTVIALNPGIHVDSGEWSAYSKVCQKGKVSGIGTYISEALKVLWTTGLDQGSWAAVKAAARDAEKMDGGSALQTILLGFFNIKSPSHNSGQWDDLKKVGLKYLA